MTSSETMRRRKEDEPKLDMTPMIDVTFQLLIFFMCTIKFKTLEGKLSAFLPKDVGVNPPFTETKEKVDIVVRVVKEGSKLDPHLDAPWSGKGPFRYGAERLIEYRIGPKQVAGRSEFAARLSDLYRADPERAATIDARPGIVYDDVVGVLDLAIEAGFTDITFKGARADRAR